MRPGIEPLIDILRGRDNAGEWAAMLDAAKQESVLPWVAERLHARNVRLNPEQRASIEAIGRDAQLAAFAWTETLKSTLSAFDRAEVPAIPLKGPCLAERLYGDAALRTCHDLDLLVRSRDLARAERVLAGLGFARSGYPEDYASAWRRNGLLLELHHNVENPRAVDFDVDRAWNSAQRSAFQGVPVWLLAPADELLHLCIHAAHHRFDRLCLILDLALAFRRLPFTPGVISGFCENAVVLGWAMATQLDAEIPRPQTSLSPQEQQRLHELARRIWNEHLAEVPQTLDWAASHRFYLEVETPGWKRVRRLGRDLAIQMTRLIDADFEFAERFRLRREWQARMLRPVRLITKKVHGLVRSA